MNEIYYPAVFHEEEGAYWVEFPDLPGCFTQGESEQETLDMAKEALGLYLDENLDIVKKFKHYFQMNLLCLWAAIPNYILGSYILKL